MIWYVVKLLLLLPLIAGFAWASLKLAAKMQAKMGTVQTGKRARLVETIMLSPTQKLAVIEFAGREILVAATRQGLVRLAEAPAREASPVLQENGE